MRFGRTCNGRFSCCVLKNSPVQARASPGSQGMAMAISGVRCVDVSSQGQCCQTNVFCPTKSLVGWVGYQGLPFSDVMGETVTTKREQRVFLILLGEILLAGEVSYQSVSFGSNFPYPGLVGSEDQSGSE